MRSEPGEEAGNQSKQGKGVGRDGGKGLVESDCDGVWEPAEVGWELVVPSGGENV